jgi:hypothetical protein
MNALVVRIQQEDKDIGWGRLGSIAALENEGSEVTVHDVHMLAEAVFEPGGPFRLEVQDNRFDKCQPVNFRNLRPGSDYDRVIFKTDTRPRLRATPPPQPKQPEK